MAWTNTDVKNIFRLLEHIQISEIQEQAHGYFGLLGNGNVIDPLPIPLKVSYLTHLSYNDIAKATEIKNVSW